RYPMAYFPETDVSSDTLQRTEYTTRHPDLGPTCWYAVRAGDKSAPRGAWQHIELPTYASELRGRVAFAWPAMDAFYEEDERLMGHAADSYHPSTSAKLHVTSWFVIMTASSPIPSGRSSCANPALRRA